MRRLNAAGHGELQARRLVAEAQVEPGDGALDAGGEVHAPPVARRRGVGGEGAAAAISQVERETAAGEVGVVVDAGQRVDHHGLDQVACTHQRAGRRRHQGQRGSKLADRAEVLRPGGEVARRVGGQELLDAADALVGRRPGPGERSGVDSADEKGDGDDPRQGSLGSHPVHENFP